MAWKFFVTIFLMLGHAKAGTPPKIRPVNPEVLDIPGRFTYLPCDIVEGDPDPSVTWTKEGKLVEELDSRFSINMESKALRIFGVKVGDDGNYTCTARNRFGTDSITTWLQVMYKPDVKMEEAPSLSVLEMTQQSLVCKSRGWPRPSFEWFTNRHQLIRASDYQNDSDARVFVREINVDADGIQSTLFLSPVLHTDMGTYTCIAKNEVGNNRAKVTLEVQFPPKVVSEHNSSHPVYWWAGHQTNLTCVAAGNGLPSATWSYNGDKSGVERRQIDRVVGTEISSMLVLQATSESQDLSGKYMCFFNNSLGGIVAHTFHVRRAYAPPPVQVLEVTVGRHEIVMSVKVPVKEDTPRSRLVFASYSEKGRNGWEYERMGDVDDQGEATLVLPGVRHDREYVVILWARNMIGPGPNVSMVVFTAISPPTTPTTTTSTLPPTTTTSTAKASSSTSVASKGLILRITGGKDIDDDDSSDDNSEERGRQNRGKGSEERVKTANLLSSSDENVATNIHNYSMLCSLYLFVVLIGFVVL